MNSSLKMVTGLALVLLVFTIAEGRIVGKCELKSLLGAALGANGNASNPSNATGNLTAGSQLGNASVAINSSVDPALVAKIVCTVERVSKFNTSLITTIQNGAKPQPTPKPQQKPAGKPDNKPGKPGKPGRGKRSSGKGKDSSDSSESTEGSAGTPINLFGIFQLSDKLACNSGSGQSLNLCGIRCTALTDDDITDDILCLKTMADAAKNTPSLFGDSLKKKKHFLCVDECLNVNPLQYFSACV